MRRLTLDRKKRCPLRRMGRAGKWYGPAWNHKTAARELCTGRGCVDNGGNIGRNGERRQRLNLVRAVVHPSVYDPRVSVEHLAGTVRHHVTSLRVLNLKSALGDDRVLKARVRMPPAAGPRHYLQTLHIEGGLLAGRHDGNRGVSGAFGNIGANDLSNRGRGSSRAGQDARGHRDRNHHCDGVLSQRFSPS